MWSRPERAARAGLRNREFGGKIRSEVVLPRLAATIYVKEAFAASVFQTRAVARHLATKLKRKSVTGEYETGITLEAKFDYCIASDKHDEGVILG